MSKSDTLELSWEWPADRSPQQSILAIVDRVNKENAGTIRNSPSMADHLPDPMTLEARVIAGEATAGAFVRLRLPNMELGDVSAGDTVVLGLVTNSICICLERAPADLDQKNAAEWLSQWSCSSSQ